MLVRQDREAYLGEGHDHRFGNVSGYRKGYNPDGITNPTISLNVLTSQISFL